MAEVVVIRDAGGIGDLVRCFAVIDALARDRRVVWYVPADQMRLCSMCPSVAAGGAEIRPVIPCARSPMGPYPTTWGETSGIAWADPRYHPSGTPVVDLMCPALLHEAECNGAPTRDRLECWARAAGVWPIPRGSVRLDLPSIDDPWDPGANAIAISPASHASIRTWRNAPTRLGRTGRVGSLVDLLRRRGYTVVIFSHEAVDVPADVYSIESDIRLQAARLRRCRAFIGPDSGILHVACALGLPAVGVFGPTLGSLVVAPYTNPLRVIQGRWTPSIRRRIGCHGPCHGFPSAGYRHDRCRGSCEPLNTITEVEIVEAVESLITRRRSLRCATSPCRS